MPTAVTHLLLNRLWCSNSEERKEAPVGFYAKISFTFFRTCEQRLHVRTTYTGHRLRVVVQRRGQVLVGQVSIAHLPQRLNGRVQERQFGPPTGQLGGADLRREQLNQP